MQKELFGRGSAHSIAVLLGDMGAGNILLVTGKQSYIDCGAKAFFEKALVNFQCFYFDAFSPNPVFEEAMAGVEVCRREQIDVVIAIGGGSAIDIAKCIAAFNSTPGLERQLATGERKLEVTPLPVIAIPTTAGTGSESTHFAVIYVDGKKYSLASPALTPSAAIIDPVFTDNLPAYITACTGFDALCQAVESFWAVGATDESRDYAKQAISLLLKSLVAAVNTPNSASRDDVLRAANYAGRAINISKTTAPHALSYTITSLYGLPHGHAVALTLGAFFPYHQQGETLRLSDGVSASQFSLCNDQLAELFGVESLSDVKNKWYRLMGQCDLSCNLAEHGIKTEMDIDKIIAGVNLERLGNHPIQINVDELKGLLKSIPAH